MRTIGISIVAILLIYVLSPGPICWLVEHGMMRDTPALDSICNTVWEPLFDLEGVPGIGKVYDDYLRLWGAVP
jgi:hypothetical protein